MSKKKIAGINVGIRNTGSKRIDMASVLMGKYRMRAGIVTPGNDAVHLLFDRPITPEATVSYVLPDGERVAKTIPFASRVPKDASGRVIVIFSIDSDTGDVDVRFFTFRQIDGCWDAVPIDGGPDDYSTFGAKTDP